MHCVFALLKTYSLKRSHACPCMSLLVHMSEISHRMGDMKGVTGTPRNLYHFMYIKYNIADTDHEMPTVQVSLALKCILFYLQLMILTILEFLGYKKCTLCMVLYIVHVMSRLILQREKLVGQLEALNFFKL